MNKHILSIALMLGIFSTFPIFSMHFNPDEPGYSQMIPGNLLRIHFITFQGQKLKKWQLQPNDHFRLLDYELVYSKHTDTWDQQWLFEAIKPGKTELIFKRKKYITKEFVEILNLHRPPNPVLQETYFQSNSK